MFRDPFLWPLVSAEIVVNVAGDYGAVQVVVMGWSWADVGPRQKGYLSWLVSVFARRVEREASFAWRAEEVLGRKQGHRKALVFLRSTQWLPALLFAPLLAARLIAWAGPLSNLLVMVWGYVALGVPLALMALRRRLIGAGSADDPIPFTIVSCVASVAIVWYCGVTWPT
jgi:hypothetical protein